MRKITPALALFVVLVAAMLSSAVNLYAAGPQWIVVNPGDTLFTIAERYGTTVAALVSANSLPNPNFVYSGQRLLIPGTSAINETPPLSNAPSEKPQTTSIVYYTVRPGDSLASIAERFGVSVSAIVQANGLTSWNFVWYGQRLQIPGATSVTGLNPPPPTPEPAKPQPPANPPSDPKLQAPIVANPPTDGKWIDVNLTNQTITAYEGSNPLKTIYVSTGTAYHPTVIGTFKILSKYPAVRMTGGTPGIDYYDLPNVPWTMFFYQGYAIHGTYWHHNFGHQMSHGCVNLPTDEAKWFYDWAPIGTIVVTHK